MPGEWKNKLFYGDNLNILRDYLQDDSVDLIYLDPPFNSKATYNVLFAEKNGTAPVSQVKAFEDFWHWDLEVEATFKDIVTKCPTKVVDLITTLRAFLGQNDMMAYLTMMTIRLVELRRVLKPTGSIYLHCDPTASHYLKIVMDAIFGPQKYRNEIIWKRSASHGGSTGFHDVHDVLLYYSKGSDVTWNPMYQDYDEEYIKSHYTGVDLDGRRYQLVAAHGQGQGPARRFGDRLIEPPAGRHWMDQTTIDRWTTEGRIVFTKSGMPRYKRYIDDTPGQPITNMWNDLPPINSQAKERLGYPTQKPETLLERIIKASSNPGDIVLDPFCGCGTAIAVAEALQRKWVGIDITHLAIALIKYRLEDSFQEGLSQYEIIGVPTDLKSAEALALQDPYQFQWWALSLIEARPAGEQKKGADSGIDGVIYFFEDSETTKKVVVQVKGGHVAVSQVRDLKGVMEREKAEIGVFIALEEPTKPMKVEAAATGFYEPPVYKGKYKYPRLQILTIEELLNGKQLEIPRFHIDTFKKAEPKSKQGIIKQQLF